MAIYRTLRGGLLAVLLGGLTFAVGAAEREKADPARVQVGMMRSYFPGATDEQIQMRMGPFRTLVESQAGIKGDLTAIASAEDLGKQLMDGKLHLGVFYSFEFAWARKAYPALKPLVIALNQQPLYAYLVVRSDSAAAGWADLQGKSLALPLGTRKYTSVFLERSCRERDKDPKGFFGEISSPTDMEDGLEQVLAGKAQATVIDSISLNHYEQRKPGRYAKLKKLQQSELFPPAVIAYRPGVLSEAMVKRIRDGLINANQTRRGRALLLLTRVTGFEDVPADYDRQLTEILKAYPPPGH
jgi:ABC-type phosphate/phosphonate transport system substrate-binding protein